MEAIVVADSDRGEQAVMDDGDTIAVSARSDGVAVRGTYELGRIDRLHRQLRDGVEQRTNPETGRVEIVQRNRVVDGERATRHTTERGEMRRAAREATEVARQRADVRSPAAGNASRQKFAIALPEPPLVHHHTRRLQGQRRTAPRRS